MFNELYDEFKEVQSRLVLLDQINPLMAEQKYLRNDLNKYVKKEEFVQRVNVINDHFQKQIEIRPTSIQVKKGIKSLDEKIEMLKTKH